MPPLTAEFVGAVRDHLEDRGPSTAGEIARRMDAGYGPVKSALDRLADMAAVCRAKDGQGSVLFWTPLDRTGGDL